MSDPSSIDSLQSLSNVVTLPIETPVTDAPVQLPDAEYWLQYLDYWTLNLSGKPKLVVRFIVASGPHRGVELQRWYNAQRLIGPAKKFGDVRLRHTHDAYRDYVRLRGRLPPRSDRVSWCFLKEMVVLGTTRTVVIDWRGRELPLLSRYSVLSELRLPTDEEAKQFSPT